MNTTRGNDPQTVNLILSEGHALDQELYLRVSPEQAKELQEALEAEGIYRGEILEFSVGPDLAVIAASILGTGGLAAALQAFFHRNRHNKVRLKVGDSEVEVQGLSTDKLDEIITAKIEEAKQLQAERDEAWRRALEQRDGD